VQYVLLLREHREKAKLVSKLDLAVIAAAVAGRLLWIEHGHRIVVEAPTPMELALLETTAACPDKDDQPYSMSCLAFMQGTTGTGGRWRINANEGASAPIDMVSRATPAACPDTDNVPYSASCLAFLRGATDIGMRWRINAVDPLRPLTGAPPSQGDMPSGPISRPTAAHVE
jgi:hypothetical protein